MIQTHRRWFLWLALVGLWVSILSLSLAGFPTTAQETNWSAIIEQVKPAVIWILVTTPEGGGSGSGFIINPDGYILTAAHVVEDAYDITVIVEEEEEYDARVVESDEDADVALLKISAAGLKSVILGDSDKVDYDDEIRVFGYPLPQAGAGLIVTAGRVQGFRHRDGVKLIQISAPINPGNSGGPLINADGEVVGMVSEFWSALTGFGLAVAINTAKSFIPPGILPRLLRVPQGFSTIQAAIDAARSGDTILIGPGTYHENDIQITKSLTLRGTGRERTIIEGDGDKQIRVEGTEITVFIEDLTLANSPSGIWAYGSAWVAITSCTISENEEGGILLISSARVEITDCTISENGSYGIGLWGSAQAEITDSTISKNGHLGNGYFGIGLGGSAQAEVTYSTISKNQRDGIRLRESTQAEITDSTISKNQHDGIWLQQLAQADITGSTVSENKNYGIMLLGSAQAQITRSTISKNQKSGIFLQQLAQAQITNSSVSASGGYGIVLRDSAQGDITGSTLSGNTWESIVLGDSAQAIIVGNRIISNEWHGVALYQQPCCDTDEVFTGHVSGSANIIPGPGEPDGNQKGTVCPSELEFLMTEEGGEYP